MSYYLNVSFRGCVIILVWSLSFSTVAFSESLVGKIRTVIEDDFTPQSKDHIHYFLEEIEGNTGKGKTLKMKFSKRPSRLLQTGTRVSIEGSIEGEDLQIAGPQSITTLSTEGVSTSAGPIVGSRSVAILLVNFADTSVGCSASSMQSRFFGSSGSLNVTYQLSSFNNLSFTGNVFGPFTLSSVNSSSSCIS